MLPVLGLVLHLFLTVLIMSCSRLPLFQFSAVDLCLVNTFLHGRTYLIVSWSRSGLFVSHKSSGIVYGVSLRNIRSFSRARCFLLII